jgi:DNA repair protein RadA/Sms
LMSAETGQALPRDMVVFGEIGLSGEVRAVSQMDARLKEASKLGFDRALTPRNRSKSKSGDVALTELSEIVELLQIFNADEKEASTVAALPPQNTRAAGV